MTEWHVRNPRDLEWTENRMGGYCELLQGAPTPALVLAVGSRLGGGVATYPEAPDPREAYAAYGEAQKVASPL
jgi:hypothetical protein